jgi:hypothetical protein
MTQGRALQGEKDFKIEKQKVRVRVTMSSSMHTEFVCI